MPEASNSPFVIVSSPGMEEMTGAILKWLEMLDARFPHYVVEYTRFASGEYMAKIPHTIRQQHVFFIHGLQPNPNEQLMKMLIANDAMRRAHAARITLVLPFLPYMRQDRKDQPRVPITARMLADLVETNPKVEGIITADLHSEQEEGFFSIPIDNLSSRNLFANHARDLFGGNLGDVMVVAPDFGSAKRNRKFAAKLDNVPVAIFEKRRLKPNTAEVGVVIGASVKGKRVLIYDDIIDTGGTIFGVAKALEKMGAKETFVFATHGIFSKNALGMLRRSKFHVTVTDSIARSREFLKKHSNLKRVSLVPDIAESIYEVSLIGGSVSRIND